MSVSGVKIIDSDIAHDTYHGIMELYDMNYQLGDIEEAFPIMTLPDLDPLENEIYVTAAALAYWELGFLTQDNLALVKQIISKSESIKAWSEVKENYGKARKKELDKFILKLSEPNNRTRNRKAPAKTPNLCFHPNDILAFKFEDNNYGLALCYDVFKDGRKFFYMLSPFAFREPDLPDLEQILSLEYFDSGGLVTTGIEHETMIKLADKFVKFADVPLKKSSLQRGRLSFGFMDEQKLFDDIFYDLDYKLLNHIYKKRPLKSLTI